MEQSGGGRWFSQSSRLALTFLPSVLAQIGVAEAIMRTIQRFLSDERAATAIEYAFINGLISVAIIAGARAIGVAISSKFYGPIASNLS